VNSSGKVVMLKAASVSLEEVVTEEYDVDIVKLIHGMLNKVILLWIIKCYLLVAECRRETNSG
jgi:hypothetical protein